MQKKETKISWNIEYKSPARKLIAVFKKGRDHWKSRYQEVLLSIQRLRTKVYQLEKSREHWKAKAQMLEKELKMSNKQEKDMKNEISQVVKKTAKSICTKCYKCTNSPNCSI